MLEHVKFENEFAETKFAKNLFLYDKKKKERMWLVIAAHDCKFSMKLLEKHLKCGSGNLRGATPEVLEATLGVKGGSVCLFAIMNDPENKVSLVMDKKLLSEFEHVGFHPMQNDFTTALKKEDVHKIIKLSGHEPMVTDFTQLEDGAGPAPTDAKKPAKQEGGQKKQEGGQKNKAKEPKPQKIEGAHELGIEYTKEQNFSKWYAQVITKSDFIEYYDISGCYILRPPAFFIWEQITQFFDAKIKKLGVQNCYFPMFVTEAALNKEKDHVEGFSPEVAWVTKSGQSDLPEPIAIRPTSETIMYPAFAKWIHSHRDLPMLLNQWTNVVRWEFKHPTPFIRTREFLWQEGHTAHATLQDSDTFVHHILDEYANVYTELLAVPVVKGHKSEDERFAGAINTATVELYVPVSGRGIQGATSHMLGQNFSKMFGVTFEDADKQKQHAWQTSWGLSTRSIGSMIMIHSDNTGMVLPPRVAQTQVIIVPIYYKNDDSNAMLDKAYEIKKQLMAKGVRVQVDVRDNHNPGFKYNYWEVRGVPVRLELGGKDMEKESMRCVVRHSGEKFDLKWDGIADKTAELMEQIHHQMYDKALKTRNSHIKEVDNWKDFMDSLNEKNICLTPWCNCKKCEERIKDHSKEESLQKMADANEDEAILTGSAKTLCIPYEIGNQNIAEGTKCFYCGEPAKVTALWGRSY